MLTPIKLLENKRETNKQLCVLAYVCPNNLDREKELEKKKGREKKGSIFPIFSQ